MGSVFSIIICAIASFGAGLTTSLSGGSGTSIISPILTCVLKVPAYDAVGIALASDVLASAVAAATYARAGNVRVKEIVPLLATILAATLFGSWVASFLPNLTLGSMTVFMMIGLGITFLRDARKPERTSKILAGSGRNPMAKVIICGIGIGLFCGFLGAGGGIMVMVILHSILKYPFRQAVGTATFVMAFTATIGAIGHFAVGGVPATLPLISCVVLTTIFSFAGANLANKTTSTSKLKRIVGWVVLAIGIVMLAFLVIGY